MEFIYGTLYTQNSLISHGPLVNNVHEFRSNLACGKRPVTCVHNVKYSLQILDCDVEECDTNEFKVNHGKFIALRNTISTAKVHATELGKSLAKLGFDLRFKGISFRFIFLIFTSVSY